MKLYLTGSTNPFFNLAAEEYLFRNSSDDVFMLWQNEPTVVIGKNQNMYAEVHIPYAEERHIHVARRITGGGAVYHDGGNINYTFITSREKAAVLDFAYFTKPIENALASLGLSASLSGRNDLLVTGKDGVAYKFSGNAETADERHILHHGTILFDSDLTVLSSVLRPDEDKMKRKGIPSVRSRVTNLKPLVEESTGKSWTTADFFAYLISYVEKNMDCRAEKVDRNEILATGLYDRNRSEEYNAIRHQNYRKSAKHISEAGIIIALWNEENGFIRDITFEGDFFGEKDTAELEAVLRGKTIEEAAGLTGTEVYFQGVPDLHWLLESVSFSMPPVS